MRFVHRLPFRTRPAYVRYARSMILDGVYFGAGFEILNYVARKTVVISEWQLSITQFFLYLGMFAGFFIPQLFRVQRKMQYIAWTSIPAKFLFIVLAFTTEPQGFFLIACVALFLAQMYIPMHAAILKSNFPASHRATIVGHVRSWALVVTVVSAAIAGHLLDLSDRFLQIIFPTAAVCGIIATLGFTQMRERKSQPSLQQKTIVPLKKLWTIMRTDRYFMRYQSAFALSGFANLAGLPLYVLYTVDVLHADYSQIAFAAGIVNNLLGVLTLRWWGRLMDRYPNPILIRAVLSLLWLWHPLCYAWASNMSLVYIGAMLYGFLQAGGHLNWMLGSLYFCSEEDTPAYTMIHSCNNGLRGSLGPLVGYGLYRWLGFLVTFYLLAGLMLIAGLLMLQLYRETRRLPRFTEMKS